MITNACRKLCGPALALIMLGSCAGSSKIVRRKGGYAVLIDKRDGSRYLTGRINGKLWTMSNARIGLPGSSFFFTPRHNPIGPEGRTYTWKLAQQACPEGWRLPTSEELAGLFLAYGKVAYSGELPYFRKIFGPYQPDSTAATYQALLKDELLLFLPGHRAEPDIYKQSLQLSLFWSSDSVANDAYAVHWDEEQKNIHFGAYPQSYFGFCRFVKKERLNKKQRQELERNHAARIQEEAAAQQLNPK